MPRTPMSNSTLIRLWCGARAAVARDPLMEPSTDEFPRKVTFAPFVLSETDGAASAEPREANAVSAAVAESEKTNVPAAVAESDLAESDGEYSVPGDSIAENSGPEEDGQPSAARTAVAGRPKRDPTPAMTFAGDQTQRRHATSNSEPEVGNFGLFFGSWGQRAVIATGRRREVQLVHDRQIEKCPAQVVCLAEASREVEQILTDDQAPGDAEATGLDTRTKFKHFCIRGNETSSLLIAARTDVTTGLELLEFDLNDDHRYREKGKEKIARTRTLVCKAHFKQNIGHIGLEVVVAATHFHYKTAKLTWPAVAVTYWDNLAARIIKYGIQFLTGDFNMSLTDVTVQLRSRGIQIDCVAWYPWCLSGGVHDQNLGFDSCGIFYIGGSAGVRLKFNQLHIQALTSAVAGEFAEMKLDEYKSGSHPGQHWSAYKSMPEKPIGAKLRDLLQPEQEEQELAATLQRRPGSVYCPYIRFKQKPLEKDFWLVGGELHNGAHFPLVVFTNNASSRSEEKQVERSEKYKAKRDARNPKHTAVAAQKGKHTAVAAQKGKGGRRSATPYIVSAAPQFVGSSSAATWSDAAPQWREWRDGWSSATWSDAASQFGGSSSSATWAPQRRDGCSSATSFYTAPHTWGN
jgi:hypothetical protein